jgi:serine/threonine protein kinase
VAFSVENICGFLIRGRLMTPDEMRSMYQRWRASARSQAADVPEFLKWLVSAGHVTEYQANLLGQGHADDFFLNQYKILERIGRGRMAGVFKAVHSLGQIVAIKVLPPSRAKSPQILARFQREARLSLRLKHPNVVRSFQVGEAKGVHYLVMEHLEGETLEDLLRRRRVLPLAEAVQLAHQTLLGLQHIHEQGMIHRDIKPANLFLQSAVRGPSSFNPEPTARVATGSAAVGSGLNDDGTRSTDYCVKILDIGLARELFEESPPGEEGPKEEKEGEIELTAEGMLLGTPDYLSPEQARDPRRSDIRADIYSVGCVLYHMLAGQPPFPDRNLFNQIVRHATETPRPLREFNPAIPEGLEQILSWLMAKQPEQRYATPARAAQALEVFLLVGGKSASAEEPPQLQKYLTWLEMEDRSAAADSTTAASPAKPPPLAALPAAAAPAIAPPLALPRKTPRKKTPTPLAAPVVQIKKAQPMPVRKAAPAPLTAAEIDVELVPLSERPAAPTASSGQPTGRRAKAVLLAVIAAAVVFLGSCACVATWIVSRWLQPSE